MSSTEDAISVVLYALLDFAALLANGILIVAIIMRTPKVLKSFSVLLLNTAVVDSFSAIFSLSAVARFVKYLLYEHWGTIFSMQSVNGTLFFIHAGPCTRIGAKFCHRSVFLQAALISHSIVLLFISFCYRLWMIGRASMFNHGQPRRRNLLVIAMTATQPSIMLFVINDAAATYDGCPEGTVCSKLWLWPISSEHTLATIAFGVLFSTYGLEFVGVFAVRTVLLKRLRKLKSPDRARHQMVFNSLTAQMLLPLSSCIGCVAFAIDFLGIVESAWLQRSVILIGSTLALGAPVINLLFLRPYRQFVIDMLSSGLIPRESSVANISS